MRRTENGELVVESMQAYSYYNFDAQRIERCVLSLTIFNWNRRDKKFVRTNADSDAPFSRFTNPVDVWGECVAKNGEWRTLDLQFPEK